MRLPPLLEPVHCQRLRCRPADRPPHQPLECRPARFPKHADEGATHRPLLHRRGCKVRRLRWRMHVANIGAECGPHPRLARKGQCSGLCNPSSRGRLPLGRLRVGRRSRQRRTGERHLPRLAASPAKGRPRNSRLEPRWNRLGTGTRQTPRQRDRARVARRRFARRPTRGIVRGPRLAVEPVGRHGDGDQSR